MSESESERVRLRYRTFRAFLVAVVLVLTLVMYLMSLDLRVVAVGSAGGLAAVIGITYLSEAAYFGRISHRTAKLLQWAGVLLLAALAYTVGRSVR